jgi:hypothetical protein
MRHLVYLLLIANLVYLGWNLYQNQVGDELVRELPPLPATARPLVTLQEWQQQQEEQRRAQQKQEIEQEDEVQGQQRVEQEVADVAAIEALTQTEPPGAGASMLCQTLGPFLAMEQLEEVAERLGAFGVETSRRSSETRLENGWWVYLPAMPRAEAVEIMQLLDDNNDREYYVGKDNFIALGTFRVLERAERRMRDARKLGLEPLLEARYKTQATHWLDLRVTAARDGDLAWVVEKYPDLRLEQQACR